MKFGSVLTVLAFIAVSFTAITIAFSPNHDEWGENDPRWESYIQNWWDIPNFTPPTGPAIENTKNYWFSHSRNLLNQKTTQKLNTNRAKNIILFIGDGMGISTTYTARSYIQDTNFELSFEKFPYSGQSKVYCVNYQVPESACTATAIMSGVKNNFNTLGLTAAVTLRNCSASKEPENQAPSFFKYAQDIGKSSGFATTTRVTHATPAATYAMAASRNWESSALEDCEDVGMQMVNGDVGKKLNVILGGGSMHLLPEANGGIRNDGRDLINEFLKNKFEQNRQPIFALNRSQLIEVNTTETDDLIGIFARDHLEYSILADREAQPSLEEMTAKAIEILGKNENGYVLMVESGRIDTGHHENRARNAMEETIEFNKAIEYAVSNTNEEDTLIVVTADHSHPLTISGYIPRHRNILGPSDFSRVDNMWMFGPSYAQGQGHQEHFSEGTRANPRGMGYMEPSFRYPATTPFDIGSHSGEDVGVYARGPWSHLFTGVYEQSFIAHGMMYAACIGPEGTPKHENC